MKRNHNHFKKKQNKDKITDFNNAQYKTHCLQIFEIYKPNVVVDMVYVNTALGNISDFNIYFKQCKLTIFRHRISGIKRT